MGKIRLNNEQLYHFTSRSNDKFYFIGGTECPLSFVFRQNLDVEADFYVGTTTSHTIECEGDIIAFASSDRRFKDGITIINDPIEKIKKISGVNYTWNDTAPIEKHRGKYDIGVIAQEVEEIIPEAVRTSKDGSKSVRYEKIIPLLIECIKTQQDQIDKLKIQVGD